MHVIGHHIKDAAIKGAQRGPLTATAGVATGALIGVAGVATGGVGFAVAATFLEGLSGGILGNATKV